MASSTMELEYVGALSFSNRTATEILPRKAPAAANKYALSFILAISSPPELELWVPAYPVASGSLLKRKRTESDANTTVAAQILRTSDTNAATRLPKNNSKLCVVNGCMSRSKHNKLCWRHGGSIKCKVADCDNRAKSKGVCWSHGGGTLCSIEKCNTISVSRGFCWAHGGGKRCVMADCSKPACARTQNYCSTHFKKMNTSSRKDLET